MECIFKKLENINVSHFTGSVDFDLTPAMHHLFDGVTVRKVYKEDDYLVLSNNDGEWYISPEWVKPKQYKIFKDNLFIIE
jgi:hypothetical protein